MNRILRLLVATLLGLVLGSLVNMGLIMLGGRLIPPPAGADVNTLEGLKIALPLFEPRHFVFPFLAHALGTLAGACLAARLAPARSVLPATLVGGFFLIGGISNIVMLPSPLWFSALDLLLAYGPMAWLAQAWAARSGGRSASIS